jgi:uncharacterized protein (TIGR03086 family)
VITMAGSGASETAERYRKVAGQFTERVRAVPADAWDNPSPCEGWVARDVVGHLVGWMPGFFSRWGVDLSPGPSVDSDPVGAWTGLNDAIQVALEDPEIAVREADSPMGRRSLQDIVGMIVVGDVLIHTWDLSRAAGLDEKLDPDEVQRMSGIMQMSDEMLRAGGQFGPRVEVPEDADPQTQLIAFSGRQP